jgi:hypothetical protein
MAHRSFRLQDELLAKAKEVAKERRFRSLNAFVQEAVNNEIHRGGSALEQTESRVAATLDRLAKELRKANNAQQVHLAFTDGLIRYLLVCIAEPPDDALEANRARARLRYEKFLRSITNNLTGDLRKLLLEVGEKES